VPPNVPDFKAKMHQIRFLTHGISTFWMTMLQYTLL